MAGHRFEMTAADLTIALVFRQLVHRLDHRQLFLRPWAMARPGRTCRTRLGSSLRLFESLLQGLGRKAEVDLGERFTPQPGILEAQVPDLPLQPIDLLIEQHGDPPKLLGIPDLLGVKHANSLAQLTAINPSLWVHRWRRKALSAYFSTAFEKQTQLRRGQLDLPFPQPVP